MSASGGCYVPTKIVDVNYKVCMWGGTSHGAKVQVGTSPYACIPTLRRLRKNSYYCCRDAVSFTAGTKNYRFTRWSKIATAKSSILLRGVVLKEGFVICG